MYYNPVLGITTTNVCGYGNHGMCDNLECECSCHTDRQQPKDVDYTKYDEPEDTRFRDSVTESRETSYRD
jgi:hypothetical protein